MKLLIEALEFSKLFVVFEMEMKSTSCSIFKRNGPFQIEIVPPFMELFGAGRSSLQRVLVEIAFSSWEKVLSSFGKVSSDTTKSSGSGSFFMIGYGFNWIKPNWQENSCGWWGKKETSLMLRQSTRISQVKKPDHILINSACWSRVSAGKVFFKHSGPVIYVWMKGAQSSTKSIVFRSTLMYFLKICSKGFPDRV